MQNNQRGTFLQNKCSIFFLNCKFAFVFSRPLNKVLNVLTLGAFVTVPFLQRQSHLCSPRTLRSYSAF